MLTGRVPKLQEISIGFSSSYWAFSHWNHSGTAVIEEFFNSIEGLTHVVFMRFYGQGFELIRNSLLEKHGRTLRKLHVSGCSEEDQGWDVQSVSTLVQQCPLLQDLAIKLAMKMDDIGHESAWVRPSSGLSYCLPLICNPLSA